ncbi:MAG: TetR family transcriptional regulator [Firmicutes bacterium]|jgi:AcrR family transcriptional regulator|nr:TetR family transcriptional regulator [Bacillota bacterium]
MTLRNSLTQQNSEEFSMAELVERTGTSAATIRYYLLEGLLPTPIKIAPNRFLYDERHVEAILLVRLLRERKQLPIDSIKKIISELLPDLHGRKDAGTFRPEMWKTVLDFSDTRSGSDTLKRRLLQAGLEQVEQIGFDDLTIDDICRKAEVAKGTFYNYFTSKEDFFIAVINAVKSELKAKLRRSASQQNPEEYQNNEKDLHAQRTSLPTLIFDSEPAQDSPAASLVAELAFAIAPYTQITLDLLSLSIRRKLLFKPVLESLIQEAVPENFKEQKKIFLSAFFIAISAGED